MPMAATEDWKHLAGQVIERRRELGMPTRGHFARATGLSYRLLGDLERGTRGVSEGTLALVEQALGWVPGSARDVLHGGPPLVGAGPAVLTAATAVRPRERRESRSALRALTDGYRLATEIAEAGADEHGARLFEILGDIAHELTANPNAHLVTNGPDSAAEPYRTSVPTVLRMALGDYLRHLRQKNALGTAEVERALKCPPNFLPELEAGRATFEEDLVRRLLHVYDVDQADIVDEIVRLAADAGRSGWWTRYDDVLPPWFQTYVSLEQTADTIRAFEGAYVPGLLQTGDYARALIGRSQGTAVVGAGEVETQVEVRMQRQTVLFRPNPVRLWAIIDENALFWLPSPHDSLTGRFDHGRYRHQMHSIYREQIDHLIFMARKRHITLQIRRRAATTRELSHSFSLLRFDFQRSRRPDLVYIEHLTNAIYMDNPREVEPYAALFDRLGVAALSPADSIDYLKQLSRNLTDHPESVEAARKTVPSLDTFTPRTP